MRFTGKVALITGGSEGLGKGIAELFLNEGARVAVNGRNPEKLAKAVEELKAANGVDHDRLIGIAGDIGDVASVKSMFAQLLAAFGTIDILINNAARVPGQETMRSRMAFIKMMTSPAPGESLCATSELDDESWLAMINTNVNGPFFCTREALKVMQPKGYGKIVNIASTAGTSAFSAHSPHYSASKGATVAFTKSVGLEVIGAGINVNCIAPGGIATEAWTDFMAKTGEGVRNQIMQMIPARRMGSIREYASLALYLASDDAAYLVGQVISPNGGMVV